jgi:CheY-like chemotaxis protein
MGNAGLASQHLPETSEANAYIENIIKACQKAANLCKQMLAYSGKGQFVVKPINLSELIEEMSQLLKVTIPKNIVLRLDLSPQLPPVDADVTQMQQVIMNLVINAAEAIGKCSGIISIATGVMFIDKAYLAETFIDEDLAEGQYVYMEVSDTGCGMDEETHARIFEPFFTTKFTGRGLGMAAILGIIRGHKGAIKSYSELNKGTTFKVFLPRSKETSVPISLDDKIKESWHSQGVVLVIDDEETIREVAVSMLKDLGLEALTAADGMEGIEIFKHHHQDIDAVILDMTMPRMGGEDTFSELCRIDPNVKVILSSGYNEQDATNRFAGKGLAGFLQKPYTPEQLATQLAKIFDKT